MGLLGIVHSVTIEAVPAYRLCEKRVLRGWSDVRAELADPAFLDGFDHYELYVSPYGDGSDNPCMVCTRTPTDGGAAVVEQARAAQPQPGDPRA